MGFADRRHDLKNVNKATPTAGRNWQKRELHFVMQWPDNETATFFSRKQATGWLKDKRQSKTRTPLGKPLFSFRKARKLSELSTNARPIFKAARRPVPKLANGGKFSRHLPTYWHCHIAVVCCVSCLCFFFPFFFHRLFLSKHINGISREYFYFV